jgi:hypothetical protein
VADRLDWRPLEGKSFDEPVRTNDDFLKQQREKAEAMEFALAEKKRLDAEKEELEKATAEEPNGEIKTDVFGDNRHHLTIINDIKKSTDVVFVSKYLADTRMGVRGMAEKRMVELNK